MSRQGIGNKKIRVKLLKFCTCSSQKVIIERNSTHKTVTLVKGANVLKAVDEPVISELLKDGLIAIQDRYLQTTQTGKMHLRRLLSQVDEFQQQHRISGIRKIITGGNLEVLRSNEGESPLSRLRYRQAKNGKAYIDDHAFQAGERLRVDFTRGQLTQQLASNWNITQSETGGSSGRNGIGDLTDNALGARNRTEAAIKAVGPEFAGVLIDICCFLKGLEMVEKERQWPPRSAKLMLKTGLSILARHYGFINERTVNHSNSSALRHWGGEDFKPEMFPD